MPWISDEEYAALRGGQGAAQQQQAAQMQAQPAQWGGAQMQAQAPAANYQRAGQMQRLDQPDAQTMAQPWFQAQQMQQAQQAAQAQTPATSAQAMQAAYQVGPGAAPGTGQFAANLGQAAAQRGLSGMSWNPTAGAAGGYWRDSSGATGGAQRARLAQFGQALQATSQNQAAQQQAARNQQQASPEDEARRQAMGAVAPTPWGRF